MDNGCFKKKVLKISTTLMVSDAYDLVMTACDRTPNITFKVFAIVWWVLMKWVDQEVNENTVKKVDAILLIWIYTWVPVLYVMTFSNVVLVIS